MTQKDYLNTLLETYHLVRVMADKNDCRVLRLRHKELGRDLAVGMSLNLEETQTLLKCAGYAPLYVKLPFDSVVIYGVCKQLSVIEINEILFENDLETLG